MFFFSCKAARVVEDGLCYQREVAERNEVARARRSASGRLQQDAFDCRAQLFLVGLDVQFLAAQVLCAAMPEENFRVLQLVTGKNSDDIRAGLR